MLLLKYKILIFINLSTHHVSDWLFTIYPVGNFDIDLMLKFQCQKALKNIRIKNTLTSIFRHPFDTKILMSDSDSTMNISTIIIGHLGKKR